MIQAIHNKIATPGPGYLATSATSLTIANTGSLSLTTQAGLAYSVGARVRVSYTSDATKWMEGVLTSYAGTTLVFTADTSNGSGTFASWNLNLAGQPGAATAVTVGTTTTGAAGSSASVGNSGTPYAPTLNFTIPRGDTGAAGSNASAANWRGAYAGGTTYAQGDGVTYSGVAYVSLQSANTGHQPDISPSWWQNIGSAGLADPGANGVMKRTALNTTAAAIADDLSAPVYAAASGTSTITATLAPAISAYVAGTRYRIKAAGANTGAVTLNLNGIGAVAVKKFSGGSLIDLVAGDISSGAMLDVTYDGSVFIAAGMPDCGAWIAPTLQNSWVDFGGIYETTAYKKDALGDVSIRGVIHGGTTTDGTVLFVLPAGYRPPAVTARACICNSANAAAEIKVDSSGNVTIQGAAGNGFLFLGLRFSTF